jgi:hypothetical protein
LTIKALQFGMIPGKDIGCSPLVLSIAKAMGLEIDLDNITDRAYAELASVGITKEWLREERIPLSADEVISKADTLVPGINNPRKFKASDITLLKEIEI